MKTKSFVLLGLLCLFLSVSCSINKMAINAVSDTLSGTGSADVFTGDPDPELVGDALPFAIKMYEALLAKNPKQRQRIHMHSLASSSARWASRIETPNSAASF